MNPIGAVKIKYNSPLNELSSLLEWYKNDQKNADYDNWFNKIIFNERNYKKLKAHFKDHSKSRNRRIATER